MELKNRYYRSSHIPEQKFRHLVRYFTQDLSATDAAQLTQLTRKTVNTIFLRIRQRIAQDWESTQAEAGQADVSTAESDEFFCNFKRRRLQKFKGIAEHTLDLHIKETEWRWHKRHLDLYQEVLRLLRKNPL